MTDSTPLSTDLERDPTHLAAAEWLMRLQGNAISLDELVAWQSWLNESPQNSRAFARVEELSQLLRTFPAPPAISVQDLARDRYDASVPLKDWQASPSLLRLWMSVALAALLAGTLFTCAILFWKTPAPRTVTLTTAVGQNRNATLSDGSRITLGGDTRIVVSFSGRLRAIELTRGEALFKVAKDTNRPFHVRAGEATIVAVGTAFNVRRDSDRAVVLVTEGRVLVEPVTHFLPVLVLQQFEPRLRAVHVDAGQQTTAGSAGIEDPTQVVDSAAATAWQTGRLAFRLQPLHYVLENVNRYAPKPIVLEGDGVGALLITGTVERDNIAGWVSSLERVFDLRASEEPERIVIRARGGA
jgi:transmembrane sensor